MAKTENTLKGTMLPNSQRPEIGQDPKNTQRGQNKGKKRAERGQNEGKKRANQKL